MTQSQCLVEPRADGPDGASPEPCPDAPRYDVLGTAISVTTPVKALDTLIRWSRDAQGRYVCIRDMHGIMLARRDEALADAHAGAGMVTPDGMPVAILGRMRGLGVERTCGPDLMLDTFAASRAAGLIHFLYGGQQGRAEELAETLRRRYPGAVVAAAEMPPFRPLDEEELSALAARITRSGAHIVWIGLSTPKQEYLMARLAPLVSATLIGVGAAFDMHTGHVRRAPRWMRSLCLEGVFRLLNEPRRLWRRYLVLGPQFLVLALVQHARFRLGLLR